MTLLYVHTHTPTHTKVPPRYILSVINVFIVFTKMFATLKTMTYVAARKYVEFSVSEYCYLKPIVYIAIR